MENRKIALCILAISLIIFALLVLWRWDFPFQWDEGTYAIMTLEFSSNPSIILPTITGEHVEWKPPLFFWVQSVFYTIFKGLPLPVEAAMRLPSAFFGAACVSLVFLIASRLYGSKAAAVAAVLFIASPLTLFLSTSDMVDAFSMFLVLASIYSYASGNRGGGMLFLFALVLTKWLYAAAVVVFVVLHFMRSKELPSICTSFLAIPAGVAAYFLLAALFGDVNNAFLIFGLDMSRPLPTPNLAAIIVNFTRMLIWTAPLSIIFVFLSFYSRLDWKKELGIIGLCVITFIIPLSQHYLFWYSMLSVPAQAIFTAKRLSDGVTSMRIFIPIFSVLVFLGALQLGYAEHFLHDSGTASAIPSVASFMKGKSVQFLEAEPLFPNWQRVTDRYRGTDKEYLILEQTNPGILFYRFNDSSDYQNLEAVFPGDDHLRCEGYLIVHTGNISAYESDVPPCFDFLWRYGDYYAYVAEMGRTE